MKKHTNPKTQRDIAIFCALVASLSLAVIPNPWGAVNAKAEPYRAGSMQEWAHNTYPTPATPAATLEDLIARTHPEQTCNEMLADLKDGLKGVTGPVRVELKAAIEKGCKP